MNQTNNERRAGIVLVIDDDSTIRLLAKTTLTQAGYKVVEAADGETALGIFTTVNPDVVLLDIMLPGMDGFQICTAIRALPRGKDIPIIIMTGLGDNESIMIAYNAGATDFITKPVPWQTLAFRVHYIFRASQAFRDLRENEVRLSQAQHIARMGSWEWEPAEDRFEISDGCRAILNIPTSATTFNLGTFLALVHPHDLEQMKSIFDTIVNRFEPICADFRAIHDDQVERHFHIEAVTRRASNNQTVYITGTLQDISERKKTEEQIRFLAYYDSLTGLPNRVLFKEHLHRSLKNAQRRKCKLAILFLDLDRFKAINDSFGHSTGDLLLQEIAERLKKCLRQTDTISRRSPVIGDHSVARLGGDEFMILLDGIPTPESAAHVALRINEIFSEPFNLSPHVVYISCSIGISLFPDDALESEDLIKNADVAMYAAKELGRNTFQFYKADMNAASLQRLMMETLLRGAIERNEFILYFQPQIDNSTGRLVALEALIRWRRPEMGLISPATFIPIAEESSLIIDIDEWVLKNVCRQLKEWQNEGLTPVRVAVNLSGHHFRRNLLSAFVARILAESGVAPHLLELELTEGVLVLEQSEAIEILSSLRKMGVNISIDDFGTGYSSLNYLKNLPLTTLKIDRCFVKEIDKGIEAQAIIKAIIALAKGLSLEIIAEGVETEAQLTFLRENGCTIIQGFYYSPPITSSEISTIFLEERIFTGTP